jgi:GDP-L-fucose synthase
MTKVFIAGSSGLVGSAVVRSAPANTEIVVASRLDLDLLSEESVFNFFRRHSPGAVVLAAAKVGGIMANSSNHRDFLVKNLQIQNSVMMTALRADIKNFIFLGSSCIYPRDARQPVSEDALLTGALEETNEGYALAKITGIRLCKAIFEQDHLNYFSLMPTNLYGPNDNFDEFTSHVPAALIRKFHRAKVGDLPEVTVWGTGTPRREFMHVDDMANACWYFLNRPVGGELINIGTGRDISISEFALKVADIVGYKGNIVFDSSKPDGTPRKLLDVSKAHSYGWRHKIDLTEGLHNTYSWFIDALAKGEVRGF